MTVGLWNRETAALMLVASYLPIALHWAWRNGVDALSTFGLVVLIVSIWHLVFMLMRAQPPSLAALVAALAIAILAPQDLGVFRTALGVSFGVVMGELVFGGWGRNVVNPATVALSFLGFGFPSFEWPYLEEPIAWAALPAALIGMATGVLPAGVILSATAIAVIALLTGALSEPVFYAAAVVLVLLVADPVTSPVTMVGRWLGGALFAALVLLFASGWSGAAPVQIAVAAALVTSLAAPMLDDAALALWVRQRRRRHGRT